MSDDPVGVAYPAEPTVEQCNDHTRLADFHDFPAFASWYPQMGGSTGRCVVVVGWMCVDVYVWHDGMFPFSGESMEVEDPNRRRPVHLHHCSGTQFVEFGRFVESLTRSDEDVSEESSAGTG